MGCGNAAGKMIPPMVIFKGVRTNAYLVDGAPDDWVVKFTKSGWMNGVVFEDWFEFHFLPYVDKNIRSQDPTQKIVLFLDGHLSHETLYSLELAVQHSVEIVCLPPQTTHVLQPLDVSYFKSLKSRWDRVNQSYCRGHHGKFVKKTNFTKVFQEAWNDCAGNAEMIRSGFSRIGLSPFKRMSLREILGDKDLSPANSLNRPSPVSQDAENTSGVLESASTSMDEESSNVNTVGEMEFSTVNTTSTATCTMNEESSTDNSMADFELSTVALEDEEILTGMSYLDINLTGSTIY